LPVIVFIPTTFREHAILVRSLGVSQLVVAVNKLDTVDWSQQRFTDIRDKLRLFLTKQVHLPFPSFFLSRDCVMR
jgi:elongation factor 1 alpha-like protein